MEHFLELPVTYNDNELTFKVRLVTFAYTYKFYIMIEGQELIIERDDEHQFRAIISDASSDNNIDRRLIARIIESLEGVTR
jgi:hypothetical protein